MWFLLDLPLNAHRIALIRSETYISDKVIEHATDFFLKVDMALTDPGYKLVSASIMNPVQIGGYVGCALRQILIAERNFTPLWRLLKGWAWQPNIPIRPLHESDMIELYWRHMARVPLDIPDEDAMSVVTQTELTEVPVAGFERVYRPEEDKTLTPIERARAMAKQPKQRYEPQRLLTPVDLIIRECIRRELNQDEWWIQMMLDAFCKLEGLVMKRLRVFTEEQLYFLARKDFSPAQRKKIEEANRADELKAAERKKREEDKQAAEDMVKWGDLLRQKGEIDEKERAKTKGKSDRERNDAENGEGERGATDWNGIPWTPATANTFPVKAMQEQ